MKICVGLLTYNRCTLLKQAIEAMLAQDYPISTFYVVDNGSADETPELLRSFEARGIVNLRCSSNLGASGAYSLLTRLFARNGDDALLLLDDDCVAEPGMLRSLVETMRAQCLDVANAFVVTQDNPDLMAFGLWPVSPVATFRGPIFSSVEAARAARDGVILGTANPFNGILIARRIVAAIGFIDARMFIWGEEEDYLHRIVGAGARIGVVRAARARHPKDKGASAELRGLGRFYFPPDSRALMYFRNRGYIEARWKGFPRAVMRACRIVLAYLYVGKPTLGVKIFAYFFDGYFNRYRLEPSGASLLGRVKAEEERLHYAATAKAS